MGFKTTLCALVLSCLPFASCGQAPDKNRADEFQPAANIAVSPDMEKAEYNPLPLEEIDHDPLPSCTLMRGPELESPNQYDEQAKFSYSPSERFFDQTGTYWGTVVPLNKEITFTNESTPIECLDRLFYSWTVDGVVQESRELDLSSEDVQELPIPDFHYTFEREGWHEVILTTDQLHIEYTETGVSGRQIQSAQMSYFSVVPSSSDGTNSNFHPVPIIEPNYAFIAAFNEHYGEDQLIAALQLDSITTGQKADVDFTWSYDVESFGNGDDCNGIAEYSVCVYERGSRCDSPIVNTSGEFELEFDEAGPYTLELTVTDFDGLESSKKAGFEVKDSEY
ncbi:hypothetical protein KY349_05900 [Candidatus Woesearchaeota archaeon]|nr:hypothetical protein [Candidatus Woesearchaeota archaeon]